MRYCQSPDHPAQSCCPSRCVLSRLEAFTPIACRRLSDPRRAFGMRDAGIVGVNARQHSRLTVSWSYWPVATVPYKPQILMILCSGHSTKPSPRGHCALRFQSRLISEAGRRNAASKSRVGACNASPRKWKSCSNVAANPSSSGPRGSESPTLAGPLDGSRPAWRV